MAAQDVPDSPPGLSAFAAKVLDQLSLSAWLPGVFFASVLALLVQFRSLGEVDFTRALDGVSDEWLPVLLLALPVLLLAVLVIQASSFAAIQWLEGYGRATGPGRWVRTRLIKRQVVRYESLRRRRMLTQAQAFDASEYRWDEPPPVVRGLWAKARGRIDEDLPEQHRKRVAELDWRDECDPWQLAKIGEMVAREQEFPSWNSIMPTKLGNVLKATEETLENGKTDIASFVMRRREYVSPRVRFQHDQFRTRLDMYCTMTLVSGVLAALSVPLLAAQVHWIWVLVMPVVLAGFAAISYRAALSSARGYSGILRVMDLVELPEGRS